MSALNIPILYELKSGTFKQEDLVREVNGLLTCSLSFRELLESIPTSMITTKQQREGWSFLPALPGDYKQLRRIVITDTFSPITGFTGLNAGLYPAATTFDSTGTIYIYLNPDLFSLVASSDTPDTIAGRLIHEFGHHTSKAMESSNKIARESAAIEVENPVRQSLGMPARALADLEFQRFKKGPPSYFYGSNTP